MKIAKLLATALLAHGLGGCAVVAVADATVSVAATTVGAAASVAGLAVDATVGTVKLAGRAVSAVVPGSD
ncbi:hypothetical protein GT347_23325 [Xylophilus rhododendri]|uniref:Lipoprotein n=1 Tax=Xylophilus rhododendri TaxID=2697032 RepID=A0A857J9S1_9BURK|nr:hypothetical protein [Xylophilus rhododendri]QHJ00657.1 hypothetical protein GT347_23325 [Xylophilus rhododendri]